jgi:Fur family peroxide stress response transcriptional regulator
MDSPGIINILTEKGLRITPQRIVIYEAIRKLNNHPTADDIAAFIKQDHPNIATGTVYKVLESLVVNGLVKKVKTEKDVMRYDAIMENHHHLYCAESDRIADYYNNEINELLAEYFRINGIPDFEIEDIKLQIIGKFLNENR